jgi:hypothetical protein
MINNKNNILENYKYDYFCGVINHCLQDPELPVTYRHHDESERIRPLLDYIQDLAPFRQCQVHTTKPKTGYSHSIAIVNDIDQTTMFTISYGGKQQNGTICIEVKALHCDLVAPILFRHFQFRTTRIDVATNYSGDYHDMEQSIRTITGNHDPDHKGNNKNGHTNYHGARESTTCIRHYQWGLYHFPNTPEKHTINRLEIEYKPQDKKHRLHAQYLSKVQIFVRSNYGRKIQEHLYGKVSKVRLVSDTRTYQTDTIEQLKSMAIRNRNIFLNALIATEGDTHQIMALILDTITEHEHRQQKA